MKLRARMKFKTLTLHESLNFQFPTFLSHPVPKALLQPAVLTLVPGRMMLVNMKMTTLQNETSPMVLVNGAVATSSTLVAQTPAD